MAVLDRAEVIVTIDDDCLPIDQYHLAAHVHALSQTYKMDRWTPTISGPRARGFPREFTGPIFNGGVNIGLWTGCPDVDAKTQVAGDLKHTCLSGLVPYRSYIPMCGMNLAFRAELAPIMYFLLMGPDYPYQRFGDIWCGLIAKRICDHLGYAFTYGAPLVIHDRASNAETNLAAEAEAVAANETLWWLIDQAPLTASSAGGCYREMAGWIRKCCPGRYWWHLTDAMLKWADLYD